ncbi:roadblock/LC7 domain-containing protein [Thermobifida alba]|uniref:Roadblock/LC7 domain-containing protein n=1 Tax=Thermobifida alba TaxID=53522 RepID=A0ABY4L430_THEAE|nr:roadblock/LC7 domain-containing protein [Thermobifida alba]UPT22440.1 roadblock/LC7 domain-containing protein [Thermobifida alba]HLU95230.1 roadblock/LC7 domain-containing protein [Thermobifida alba]
MTDSRSEVEKFNWVIDNFVRDVPGVNHAAVVSADGLLLARSQGLSLEEAEQLAAVASGMLSLAQGTSRMFNQGEVEQTIVRMQQGHLFLTSIGDGSCLTVLAASDCDMKIVGYQMALLVENTGHVLTPKLRGELREAILN